jgi:hypothetical protein
VPEVVHPCDGHAVTLRPCLSWCVDERHFLDTDVIHADDGYYHYGPEIEVPTSFRFAGFTDGPETVVRVVLKSWTHALDAEPGPVRIEINLGTAEERTDACAEVTSGEARAAGLRRVPELSRFVRHVT